MNDPRTRFPVLVALALEALCLAVMAAGGETAGFTSAPDRAWVFVAAGAGAGAAYAGAARCFAGSRTWFWTAAVGLRLIALAAPPGDDLWRYLWEGRIQLHGFNPYLLAPDAPALASLRDAVVWPRVNHREWAAIYPPLVETGFHAMAALGAGPLAHKAWYALADLGTCAGVVALAGGDRRRAAWYAWNPLAIYEFAGAGHFDSLMVVTLVAGACLLGRTEGGSSPNFCRRTRLERNSGTTRLPSVRGGFLPGVCLGLGVALKLAPAVLLPTWAWTLARRHGWTRACLWLLPTVALLPATAMLYGWPTVPVFRTLGEFAHVTRLNDAVWWLSETLLWSNPERKNGVYQVVLALVCLALAARHRDAPPARVVLAVLGAAVLLSPALHPWYALWVLPFAVAAGGERARRGWVVLCVSLFGYYLLPALNPVLPWREPTWLRLAIFGPPLLAAVLTVQRASFSDQS